MENNFKFKFEKLFTVSSVKGGGGQGTNVKGSIGLTCKLAGRCYLGHSWKLEKAWW